MKKVCEAIEKVVDMYFNNIPLDKALEKVKENLSEDDRRILMGNCEYIKSLKQGPTENIRGWSVKRLSI